MLARDVVSSGPSFLSTTLSLFFLLSAPDLHVLLLEDLLVLLQKQDEKLVLKCHGKTALGSLDNKQTFSPVLKLNSVLIRSVATGSERGQQDAGGGRGPVLLSVIFGVP